MDQLLYVFCSQILKFVGIFTSEYLFPKDWTIVAFIHVETG